MKTNKINILFILAATLLFSSCEKEIKFKGEETASRLVVNAIATAGEPLNANVGRSVFFLNDNGDSENFHCPDNAYMSLYVNGNLVETLTADGNQFSSSYVPSAGDTIRLTASAPDFDDVEASTLAIPDAPSFTFNTVVEKLKFSSYIKDDTVYYWFYATGDVIIDLYDTHPGNRDCYNIRVIESKFYEHQKITYDDPVFENFNEPFLDEIYSSTRPFFTDKIFDGSHYQLTIPFDLYSIDTTEYITEAGFEIVLDHIDRNLYEYYNTLYTANQDEVGLLSEPVHVHSNVDGGYGIVAGRNCDTIKVRFEHDERRNSPSTVTK